MRWAAGLLETRAVGQGTESWVRRESLVWPLSAEGPGPAPQFLWLSSLHILEASPPESTAENENKHICGTWNCPPTQDFRHGELGRLFYLCNRVTEDAPARISDSRQNLRCCTHQWSMAFHQQHRHNTHLLSNSPAGRSLRCFQLLQMKSRSAVEIHIWVCLQMGFSFFKENIWVKWQHLKLSNYLFLCEICSLHINTI